MASSPYSFSKRNTVAVFTQWISNSLSNHHFSSTALVSSYWPPNDTFLVYFLKCLCKIHDPANSFLPFAEFTGCHVVHFLIYVFITLLFRLHMPSSEEVRFTLVSKLILIQTHHQQKAGSLAHWWTPQSTLFSRIHNCPMSGRCDLKFCEICQWFSMYNINLVIKSMLLHSLFTNVEFEVGRKHQKKAHKKITLPHSFNFPASSWGSPWLYFLLFRDQGLGIV